MSLHNVKLFPCVRIVSMIAYMCLSLGLTSSTLTAFWKLHASFLAGWLLSRGSVWPKIAKNFMMYVNKMRAVELPWFLSVQEKDEI